ncbi:hypothetical protein ACN27E_15460 [Mycobacterium sp. WMMD1722]|uniref:hypothetical protein n=1 Tax=Mycobacterium sp. WMMD1722 TaxID=3404117 RepID=UPI003BF5705C
MSPNRHLRAVHLTDALVSVLFCTTWLSVCFLVLRPTPAARAQTESRTYARAV